jgi:hypothetical protein
MSPLPNYTTATTYQIHTYVTSPLTTWPPPLPHTSRYNTVETPHIHYVTPNKMASGRYPTFAITNLYGVTPCNTSPYNMAATRHVTFTNLHDVTIQPGRHTNLHTSRYMADTPYTHYVTPNIAAERHAAFTTTNRHGITPSTYITTQHGRRTKNTNIQGVTDTHTKISAFDSVPNSLLQDGVHSTGYTRRVD